MPGYLLLEERMLKPYRSQGFEPNPSRLGILDYLRELRHETFPFTREHSLRIVGLEDVLLSAGENIMEVSLFIRRIMAAKANDLESNLGSVQIIFRRPLNRADDFWFEPGGGRHVSLRPIFGSPIKQTDSVGNEYYQVGFNLT